MKKRYKLLIVLAVIFLVINLLKGMMKLTLLYPIPIIVILSIWVLWSDDETY